MIKRAAEGNKGIRRAAEGNKGIKRAVAKKVLRSYGRLSKKDVGSETKWGRAMKMDDLEKLRREQWMFKMRTLRRIHRRKFLTNLSKTWTWLIIECKSYQLISKH